MGFRDPSGIDLPSEQKPIYPATTAYFDKLYGPRNWSPPATTLNFSIGQGENTQTLINMVRFYEGLAGNGESEQPYVVRRDPNADSHDFGLTDAQLLGLRRALTAVAERGTASAIINATPGSHAKVLQIAGKTGTAQNPHGLDHRWFIAMAPADEPQLIVGGIMENVGLHDPLVVRNVYLALRRYILGPDSSGAEVKVQISVPEDGGTILTQPDEGPVPVPPEPDSTPPPDSRP
jgi:penicillin-binding protein 2